MSTTVLTIYMVLVGLAIGSFMNLAIDRLPRGESLFRPPSHCRSCGRHLNVVDLLPVAGYVIRRGRCATCGARIGVSAPIIESLCGACMATPVLLQGVWPGAVTGSIFLLVLGSVLTLVAVRRVRRV